MTVGDVRSLATKTAMNRLQRRFKLSGRELASLRAILLGEKADGTAYRLGISPSTLKSYRKRAYAKLMVENELEAVIRVTASLVQLEFDPDPVTPSDDRPSL